MGFNSAFKGLNFVTVLSLLYMMQNPVAGIIRTKCIQLSVA